MISDMTSTEMGLHPLDEKVSAEVRAELARQKRTRASISTSIGMHPNVFSRKCNGQVGFTATELAEIAKELDLTATELIRRAEQNRD